MVAIHQPLRPERLLCSFQTINDRLWRCPNPQKMTVSSAINTHRRSVSRGPSTNRGRRTTFRPQKSAESRMGDRVLGDRVSHSKRKGSYSKHRMREEDFIIKRMKQDTKHQMLINTLRGSREPTPDLHGGGFHKQKRSDSSIKPPNKFRAMSTSRPVSPLTGKFSVRGNKSRSMSSHGISGGDALSNDEYLRKHLESNITTKSLRRNASNSLSATDLFTLPNDTVKKRTGSRHPSMVKGGGGGGTNTSELISSMMLLLFQNLPKAQQLELVQNMSHLLNPTVHAATKISSFKIEERRKLPLSAVKSPVGTMRGTDVDHHLHSDHETATDQDSGPEMPSKTNSLKIDITKHQQKRPSASALANSLFRANSDPAGSPVPDQKANNRMLTTPQSAFHSHHGGKHLTPSHSVHSMQSLSNLSFEDIHEAKLPPTSPEIEDAGGSLATIASQQSLNGSRDQMHVTFKPEVPMPINTNHGTPDVKDVNLFSPSVLSEALYSQTEDLNQCIDSKLLQGTPGDEADLISPTSTSNDRNATPIHGIHAKIELSPTPELEESDIARLDSNVSGSNKSNKSSSITAPKSNETPRIAERLSESTPLNVIPSDNDDEKGDTPSPAPMEMEMGKLTTQSSSTADVFAQSLIPHMYPDGDEKEPETEPERQRVERQQSVDDAQDESIRLKPSKYQQEHTDDNHHRTLTISPTASPREPPGESPGEPSEARTVSLQIGVNPYKESNIELSPLLDIHKEDDELNRTETDLEGDSTPKAVREGTETIQKTLRAVWVRGHTQVGTVIQVFLILMNTAAAVFFVAAIDGHEFENVEYLLTSVFLVDFCIRIYAAKSAMRYLFSFKGMLDFISVVPGIVLAIFESVITYYHIDLALKWETDIPLWTFHFARAMRVLRILKLLRHIVKREDIELEEMDDPLGGVESRDFIDEMDRKSCCCCSSKFWVMPEVMYYRVTLVAHIFMMVFVGAGLFACVEGPQSSHVEVASFFESFYFVVVTITTLGYGDFSPETDPGRFCVMVIVCSALVVIPYRASVLAQIEFEIPSPESEISENLNINLTKLKGDRDEYEDEYDDEIGPYFGYCGNCGGPRWTIGTPQMPISCIQCYHPVLTPDQCEHFFPEIAGALETFQKKEECELLMLMQDAKEGADQGLLPVIQQIVKNQMTEEEAMQRMQEHYLQQLQSQFEERSPSPIYQGNKYHTPIASNDQLRDATAVMSLTASKMVQPPLNVTITTAEEEREPKGHIAQTLSQPMTFSPIVEMDEEIDSGRSGTRSSNRSPSKSSNDQKVQSNIKIAITGPSNASPDTVESKEQSETVDGEDDDENDDEVEFAETPQPAEMESGSFTVPEIATSSEDQFRVERRATPLQSTPKSKGFGKGMPSMKLPGVEEEEPDIVSPVITQRSASSRSRSSLELNPRPSLNAAAKSVGSPRDRNTQRVSSKYQSMTPKFGTSHSDLPSAGDRFKDRESEAEEDSEFSTESETDSGSDSGDESGYEGDLATTNMKTQLSIIMDDNDFHRKRSRTVDQAQQSSESRRRWSSIDHDNRLSRKKPKKHAQTTRNPKKAFKFAGKSSKTVPYGAEVEIEDDDEATSRYNNKGRQFPTKRMSAQLLSSELPSMTKRHPRSGSAAIDLSAFDIDRDVAKSATNLLMKEQIKHSQKSQGKKRKGARKSTNAQRDSALKEISQSVFENRMESSGNLNLSAELDARASPQVITPTLSRKKKRKRKKKRT